MILLLGGTSDAEKIAKTLQAENLAFVVSVATDYGVSVTQKYTDKIVQGRMDAQEMATFIKKEQIDLVIDGTHPFANLVSENAILACKQINCDYLRFERQSVSDLPNVITVATSEEACRQALKTKGMIYLTVGSKTMAEYVSHLPLERIKTRVLPVSSVIQQLEELGLNSDHIEAIKGPFSEELNEQLLRQAKATALITKESGNTGGMLEKSQACFNLGIPCIVIERPKINYPNSINTVAELTEWLKEVKR